MPFALAGGISGIAASRAQKVRRHSIHHSWPFVVTSTSIGQKDSIFTGTAMPSCIGIYPPIPWTRSNVKAAACIAIKGHAVRKNIASQYGHHAMKSRDKDRGLRCWTKAGRTGERENDLVPYWIYPIEGGALSKDMCHRSH